jgi:hypothetical protein
MIYNWSPLTPHFNCVAYVLKYCALYCCYSLSVNARYKCYRIYLCHLYRLVDESPVSVLVCPEFRHRTRVQLPLLMPFWISTNPLGKCWYGTLNKTPLFCYRLIQFTTQLIICVLTHIPHIWMHTST